MSLIYKTLFEVKLTHEYYLTNPDGTTVFALANQADRLDFMFTQFANDQPSVNSDIDFQFPAEFRGRYDNYCLKLLHTYSGFKVAIRVTRNVLADGSLVYAPFVALPEDLAICVEVIKKSGDMERYTHAEIYDPVAAIYIFSNEDILSPKSFPFLTGNIPAFDASRSYTQGDLASYGLNDIRQYYRDSSGDQWETIPGSAFANSNDRLLAPSEFYYSFVNNDSITSATFVLKDKNADVVKTITVNSGNAIPKALLDFTDVAGQITAPESFPFADSVYSLEVSGSGGFSRTHPLIFSDRLYNRDHWGVVVIKNDVTNPGFNLVANDGYIVKRRSGTGSWTEAPVFELPVKSRFPFFRFINDKRQELELTPSLADYLNKEGNVLISKRPRSVTAGYFKLQKPGSSNTVYVPNPVNYDIKKDDIGRLCMDIMTPQSDLFPVS